MGEERKHKRVGEKRQKNESARRGQRNGVKMTSKGNSKKMQFKKIVGQQRVKQMLAKSADQGRVSHAQLFAGKSGSGTLPMAIAYAQYINCTNKQNGDSCGECPSCHKIERLQHPDLHFVFPMAVRRTGAGRVVSDNQIAEWREIVEKTEGYFNEMEWYRSTGAENQLGIISRADADEIIKKLSLKAFEAEYKVMIIWQPEKMRDEAANAILKILEEPWPKTLFIMVSEEPEQLLPTIISRTQRIDIPATEQEPLVRYLEQEQGVETERAKMVARLSKGDLIEAKRLIRNQAEEQKNDDLEIFIDLMRLSYTNSHMELLEWADKIAIMGREEQRRFFKYSIGLLRESYMMNAGMEQITYLWGEEQTFCKNFSPYISNHNIEQIVEQMERVIRQVEQNGNPRVIFPHFVLEVSRCIVKL